MSGAACEAVISRRFRAVVDETSFNFREVDDEKVETHLDAFNGALSAVGRGKSALHTELWLWECRDGLDLMTFLAGRTVDRDVALRFRNLLDQNCEVWDDGIPGLPAAASIAGREEPIAFSIGYALHHVANKFGVCCLVFGADPGRRGLLPTSGDEYAEDVMFVASEEDLPDFWRSLFDLEKPHGPDFFATARSAFPELVFHPDLNLSKFVGPDHEVRPWLVNGLRVLNDHFPAAHAEAAGVANTVQRILGHHDVDLSPDSVKTHKHAAAMRQRVIRYAGVDFTCEWHLKVRGYPNRVHFSLPDDRLGGKILIGVFTSHLDL